jgi:hypothetical protein
MIVYLRDTDLVVIDPEDQPLDDICIVLRQLNNLVFMLHPFWLAMSSEEWTSVTEYLLVDGELPLVTFFADNKNDRFI